MNPDDIDDLLSMLDEDNLIEGGKVNQRRNERRPLNLHIRFYKKDLDGKLHPDPRHPEIGKTHDISSGGVSLETSSVFCNGDLINFFAIDAPRFLSAEVKVRHFVKTDKGYKYGCQFSKINKAEDFKNPPAKA